MGTSCERIAACLSQRVAAGEDGKTFLLGLAPGEARFAVSAGLRGEADHPGFLTFARYLIHQRFCCMDYALLLPATSDDAPVYVVERHSAGRQEVAMIDAAGECRELDSGVGLIGELDHRDTAVPGIMRRDFDLLYERLRLDPCAS